MKRIILALFLAFLLVFPYSLVTFASGVGGALDVIQGSNIDPRTDNRYKDKFDFPFDSDDAIVQSLIDSGYKQCDLVFTQQITSNKGIYFLKRYWRIYYPNNYLMSFRIYKYGNPATIGQIHGIIGDTSNKPIIVCKAVEEKDGSFTVSQNLYNAYRPQFYSYYESDCIIDYSDVPIFENDEDAFFYNNTGIVRNADYDSTVYYSGDDLYFKDFRVTPHVSSDYDKFYFDIYYELSDFAKENLDKLNLRLDNRYTLGTEAIASILSKSGDNYFSNSFSIAEHPKGFKLYLADISSLNRFVGDKKIGGVLAKKQILGNEFFIDTSGLSLDGFGGETLLKITVSNLYCQFYLRANIDGKFYQSKRNDFNYDFLNKSYDMDVWVPTEDSSTTGNFDYVKDGDTITSSEYYYNEVTTNNNGDTVNNYYYYDSNGNKKEITEDVYNNSSANVDIDISVGDGSGEYISISPIDFNQFVKALKAMLDEFDTKGGLFLLLRDVFSMYPPDVSTIASGAIAGIFIVSVICILRKR